VVPSAAGTTISPSTAEFALMRQASCATLLETLGPIVAAAGEDLDRFVYQVNLDAVTIELHLVNPAIAGGHFLGRRRQRGLDESGEGRLHADRRCLRALKRHAQKLHATKADSNWHRSDRSEWEKLELDAS
jgi:hypothetical protein